MIKALINVLSILALIMCACMCAFFGLSLWDAYNDYYSLDDVKATCEVLQLSPEADFCHNNTRQNHTDLENALVFTYPLLETDYTILAHDHAWDMTYNYGNCADIVSNRRNLCPAPNQCLDNYSCYLDSPVQRIYILFIENGQVIDFSVPPTGS